MTLTPELEKHRVNIEGYARDFGLDFFDTIFELLDFKQLNEVASYGGFPTRYPHWKFGMEYDQLSKGYAYGLQKIYEMVINNDPCYAYLLNSNNIVDQKLVMAHVYAHCDFFKNNYWFSKTNRKMMDEMANHGTKVRKYVERHGEETVEKFMDVCLSIEDLIDPYSQFVESRNTRKIENVIVEDDKKKVVYKLKSKPYMEEFINPKEFLDELAKEQREKKKKQMKVPAEPERDVLLFLLLHAPLANWQTDILSIVREESVYFVPQGRTKIMNEGWASYWHSKIMTEKALDTSEIIDYADHHSGTVAMQPGRMNPYKIGIELFRHIEDKWNKGKFGKEYDECDNYVERKNWDKKLGIGREKIFQVRKIYNDVTFIDEFLDEEFCIEHKLFVYKFDKARNQYVIDTRNFKAIKQQFLFSLTNFGRPFIFVEDSNYENRGELYLKHRHEGLDLKYDYTQAVLENVCVIWKRPVNLETVYDEKPVLFSYDGKEHKKTELK